METTNHVDFPLSMAAIAQTLIKHPDPHMVAFFKRCASEEAERDPRGEERRDRSLLRFGRILRTLTPFTADDVRAAVDSLRGSCADGMSMDEADAVERSAEEFAVHHHAACVAARAAGFEADAPCIESRCREIDIMQDFLLDGRTALTLQSIWIWPPRTSSYPSSMRTPGSSTNPTTNGITHPSSTRLAPRPEHKMMGRRHDVDNIMPTLHPCHTAISGMTRICPLRPGGVSSIASHAIGATTHLCLRNYITMYLCIPRLRDVAGTHRTTGTPAALRQPGPFSYSILPSSALGNTPVSLHPSCPRGVILMYVARITVPWHPASR